MKTGMAAYDSGMRGGEKPREKSETGGGERKPGKVREFRVERSENGGFAVHVHDEEMPGKPGEVSNYQAPKLHVHPDKDAMMEHVGALADEMGEAARKEGAAKSSFGKSAPNPATE